MHRQLPEGTVTGLKVLQLPCLRSATIVIDRLTVSYQQVTTRVFRSWKKLDCVFPRVKRNPAEAEENLADPIKLADFSRYIQLKLLISCL